MPKRFILAIAAGALSISPVAAQIRGAGLGTGGFGISAGTAGTGSGGVGLRGFAGGARFHHGTSSERGSILLPYPYFYSDLGDDAGRSSQPEIVVVQAPAPAPVAPPEPAAPRESLLIEWQGDHFVRSTASARASAGAQIAPDYSSPDYAERPAAALSASGRSLPEQKSAMQARELPPAVLVFHDGRQEELREYTIMNGAIYSKADYWTTGHWTRKIQIADLDVPATMKLNRERGLKFALPSSS